MCTDFQLSENSSFAERDRRLGLRFSSKLAVAAVAATAATALIGGVESPSASSIDHTPLAA